MPIRTLGRTPGRCSARRGAGEGAHRRRSSEGAPHARRLWFFDPSHLLWLHANHRPLIEGTDDGIWRRVLLIPFDVQIPASQRDPYLADRILDEESAGVLNWMLAGLADYQANGLTAPATVEAATTNYRTESDSVKAFLADSALTVDPRCSLSANELLALHSEWFNATGSTEPEKDTTSGLRRGSRSSARSSGAPTPRAASGTASASPTSAVPRSTMGMSTHGDPSG